MWWDAVVKFSANNILVREAKYEPQNLDRSDYNFRRMLLVFGR